jgi:beta-glucosidase-like glycosyl hydrolase
VRLDIPAYDWWNEALAWWARAGRATVFPQTIGLAAAWDADLMHRGSDVISTEARAKYSDAIRQGESSRYLGLTFRSPNINIFRASEQRLRSGFGWHSAMRIMRIILHSEQVSDRYGEIRSQNP